MEIVAQIFGMTFLAIILICLAWTIGEYIILAISEPGDQNKKLMDNMNKLDKNKREKQC